MGCGNQIGCLGPKPREREVYLDLIDKIYQEANIVTISQNQDIYLTLKNHLLKKGLLRKLIDNLVSHRANLSQCLHQNQQMAVLSKDTNARVVSLIIIDKICDEIFEEQANNGLKQSVNTKSAERMQRSMENRDFPPVLIEKFQNVYILSSTYLKLILFLFQNQPILYREAARSLKKFFSSKVQKQPWKGEMSNIFQCLVNKIKKSEDTNDSAEIIALLLKNVKENLVYEVKKEVLEYFIKSCLQDGLQQKEARSCRFTWVLEQYVKKVNGQFQILSQSIIGFLDQRSFQPATVQKLHLLLKKLAHENQGHKNFQKCLLTLLLNYLQIQFQTGQITNARGKHYNDDKCKLNAFRLLTKWIIDKHVDIDSIIEYNPSVIIMPYLSNIQKKIEIKFQGQLKAQLFQVLSVLKQDSVIILINKICEQFAEKSISSKKREIILRLIFQILKEKEQLIRNLKPGQVCKLNYLLKIENFYCKQIKIQLLQLAQFTLRRLDLNIIHLNAQANNQFLIKIAEFFHSVYLEIFTIIRHKENISHREEQSIQSKDRKWVNNFLYICNFVKIFCKLLQLLQQFQLGVVLLCFLQPINSKILDNDPFQDQEQAITAFFLQFLIEKGLFFLTKTHKVDEAVEMLSQKIQSHQIKQEQRSRVVQGVRNMVKKELQNAELGQFDAFEPLNKKDQLHYFTKINQRKIQKAKQICRISLQQKSQTEQVFKYYFCPPFKQKNQQQGQNWPESVFNRVPSINLSLDQIINEKLTSKHEGSQSFMEIMQKMQKE